MRLYSSSMDLSFLGFPPLNFWLVSCSPQPGLQSQASRAVRVCFFSISIEFATFTDNTAGYGFSSSNPNQIHSSLTVRLLVFKASIALAKLPAKCAGAQGGSSSRYEGRRLSSFSYTILAVFYE